MDSYFSGVRRTPLFFLGALLAVAGVSFSLAGDPRPSAAESEERSAEALAAFGAATNATSLEETLASCRKAVQLDPGEPLYRNWLGWALFWSGDYAGAVEAFEAAGDGSWHYYHAKSLLGVGRAGDARGEFQKARLSEDPDQNRGEDVQFEIRRTFPLLEKHFASLTIAQRHFERGELEAARDAADYAREIFDSREARRELERIREAEDARDRGRGRALTAVIAVVLGFGVLFALSGLEEVHAGREPAARAGPGGARRPAGRYFCGKCLAESAGQSPSRVSSSGGFGTEFFGRSAVCPACGSAVRTLWLCALVPLAPRGSYRYLDMEMEIHDDASRETFLARRTRLRWLQVLGTYAAVAVVLGPLAAGFQAIRWLAYETPVGGLAWLLLTPFPLAASFFVRFLAGRSAADRRPLAERVGAWRLRVFGSAPPAASVAEAAPAARVEAWRPPAERDLDAGYLDPAGRRVVILFCLNSGHTRDFLALVAGRPAAFQRVYGRGFLAVGDYDTAAELLARAGELPPEERGIRELLRRTFSRRPSQGRFTDQDRYMERMSLAEELARLGLGVEATAVIAAAPEKQRASLAASCLRGGAALAALAAVETVPRPSWGEKEYACAARALRRLGRRPEARALLTEAKEARGPSRRRKN